MRQPVLGEEAEHVVDPLGNPRLVPELDSHGPSRQAAGQRRQVVQRAVAVPDPRGELKQDVAELACRDQGGQTLAEQLEAAIQGLGGKPVPVHLTVGPRGDVLGEHRAEIGG